MKTNVKRAVKQARFPRNDALEAATALEAVTAFFEDATDERLTDSAARKIAVASLAAEIRHLRKKSDVKRLNELAEHLLFLKSHG